MASGERSMISCHFIPVSCSRRFALGIDIRVNPVVHLWTALGPIDNLSAQNWHVLRFMAGG